MSKLKKTLRLIQAEGSAVALRYCVSYVAHKTLGKRLLSIEDICYRRWRRRNFLSAGTVMKMKAEAEAFAYRPLVSIIMPVFNVDAALLRQAVRSVENQIYSNWELCIADDCSTMTATTEELERLAAARLTEARLTEAPGNIKVKRLPENAGIAAASNAAMELAEGEFIALLDHDDELSADALFEMVKLLNEHPDTDMVYSDEDKLDESGRHVEAFMKPDWSPELLMSNMYTCHLGIYRKSLIDEIGGFRKGFEGAQDYDLVLRLTERTQKVRHIPRILYHWRRVRGSTSIEYETGSGGKSAVASSIKALDEALERRNIYGKADRGLFAGSYRIRPAIPEETLVSIIIPTRDRPEHLRKCVESITQKTGYPKYEIIIVDNRSSEKQTREYLASLADNDRIRVKPYDADFNFSSMNNFAAGIAKGDILVFLNNDTEVIEGGWLEAMIEMIQLPDVALAGAKLLYPDNTVQHAGIVLWHCGAAGHMFSRFPADDHGYFGMADSIRNCSAVSGACMMVRKALFQQLGGFDPSYAISYQDVDLCLRAREAGYRIVFTPFALLYHHESASTGMRADEREERLFTKKWSNKLPIDGYYSPNFPIDRLDFRLR